jgi:hypothetical protein
VEHQPDRAYGFAWIVNSPVERSLIISGHPAAVEALVDLIK